MRKVLTIVFALISAYACSESEQGARIVLAEGYHLETHSVVTKDGYILELHRIIPRAHPRPLGPRPVVFLMHGLSAASNSFTYAGPEQGIAYNIVDSGYDVWMGNVRGNRFSRKHVTLDPDKDKLSFFDYSFEEIALYDLPALFDYILGKTHQPTLHYIGHSQGGTVFLILNSMTNEYHEKIASAHLLAGVGYMNYFPNVALKLVSANVDTIYTTMRLTGNVELFPPSSKKMIERSTSPLSPTIERALGIDISSELMGGASWKQVAHYGQNIRDRKFRRWNYGPILNLSKYGTLSPPEYDLSKINIDVVLHYSLSDTLLSEKDTLAMAQAMPRAKARKVARDSFTHVDYINSADAKALVTDYIIEALKRS